MIRLLALVAFIGFVVSVACLGAAAAIGGQDIVHNGWRFPADWHVNIHDDGDDGDDDGGSVDGGGPNATRQIAWDGSDALAIEVPAHVRFTQTAGPAQITVTGPKGAVDHLEVRHGRLRFDRPMFGVGSLTVTMNAPAVHRFEVDGSGELDILAYDQDRLDIQIDGSGATTAQGKTHDVSLDIAGSGSADLGKMAADNANVDISGSGDATVGPKSSAALDISGSGGVTLTTRPPSLQTDITGSGRVTDAAAGATGSKS